MALFMSLTSINLVDPFLLMLSRLKFSVVNQFRKRAAGKRKPTQTSRNWISPHVAICNPTCLSKLLIPFSSLLFFFFKLWINVRLLLLNSMFGFSKFSRNHVDSSSWFWCSGLALLCSDWSSFKSKIN